MSLFTPYPCFHQVTDLSDDLTLNRLLSTFMEQRSRLHTTLSEIHVLSELQAASAHMPAAARDEIAAAEIVRQLAESIPDLELRQGFVSSPLVAPILTEPAERLPRLTSGDS